MSDITLTPETTTAHGVKLTDAAAAKVKSLLEQEGRDDLRLRVAVQPGGCSGLIYQLYFDERYLEGDATVDFDGVEVIVDNMSVPYLDGARSTSRTPSRSRDSPSTTPPTRRAPAPAATASTDPRNHSLPPLRDPRPTCVDGVNRV